MRKIAIVGGGVEGASNYRYFSAQSDTQVTVRDQNNLEQANFPNAELITGEGYLDDLDQYDLVVHSPGIRPDKLIVDPSKITTATQEFFTHCKAPIIGVTGSKGKGTTASLIANFLQADGKNVHLIGNIGKPALDELAHIQHTDWVVYELSSFQLMEVTQSPHIAVHLMFEPDHLDWHKDMNEYQDAKANIFRFQKADDIAVYYAGSKQVIKSVELSGSTSKIPFDWSGKFSIGAYVLNHTILFGPEVIADTKSVALVGDHMLDNVCAAVAATYHLIQDREIYTQVLNSFTGLPHRLQVVAENNGVRYIDDSISTIPTTAIAAIKAFDDPKLLILGGSDKGNDFDELARVIATNTVKKVYLIGIMADKIAHSLDGAGYLDYQKCDDLEEVVDQIKIDSDKGDVVLLSPACASFDMFTSYAQRGDQFTQLAKNL